MDMNLTTKQKRLIDQWAAETAFRRLQRIWLHGKATLLERLLGRQIFPRPQQD
jgi:hypothetical protein